MIRRLWPGVLLVLSSCASSTPYFTGVQDRARIERGEIFVDGLQLGAARHMVRAVAVVDAPVERVWNVVRDVEGFPEWNQFVSSVKVLRHDATQADVEWVINTPGVTISPLRLQLTFDEPQREVSIHGFENDWAQDIQTVYKLEPVDGGRRTLFTAYSVQIIKAWWSRAAGSSAENKAAESLQSIRRVVGLPRFARAPVVEAPAAERVKLLVPGFTSSGVSEEVAHTLNRVFAEQVMRSGAYNVVTDDEMVALLNHAQRQQLVGCRAGDCVTDLGRALQADRIVQAAIGKVGSRFVFTASLIRLPGGDVEKRVAREAAGDDELLSAVRGAAADITSGGTP